MSAMASSGAEANISTSSTNVPAFVAKLWSLVDDEQTNELINWGTDGKSFHLYDHFRFAKEILPLFFKHSNLSSFIRQLNMFVNDEWNKKSLVYLVIISMDPC